jgi:hypothetical protein
MDPITFTTISFVVIVLLAFLVNYLLEPNIRKTSTNVVYFAFALVLIFSSFKMLYTGEMGTFNIQKGEAKIFMGSHPLQFWGSLIFQLCLGSFILYSVYLRIKKDQ